MKKELWLDIKGIAEGMVLDIVTYAIEKGFNGVCLDVKQLTIADKLPQNIKLLVRVNNDNRKIVEKYVSEHPDRRVVVLFDGYDENLSRYFQKAEQGIYIEVNDGASMEKAIDLSKNYKTIVIQFDSVTNIPLELILAYSQKYNNTICKVIENSEDGWVAMMTMEMGSQAILMKYSNKEEISKLRNSLDSLNDQNINVEELKVVSTKHVGMGDRVCIDTISKLDDDEGMILGSTSSGGILVSSENHYLPYMDLRPFRVNAGAIHSYVLCPNNKTKYLSELRTGDEVLAINSKGRVRAVSVGRIKMEKRPMLLIKAKSAKNKEVSVIVQDDWHIRILSSKGTVKNSVLLKEGETILGYTMEEGRHLGVAINETIIEQ